MASLGMPFAAAMNGRVLQATAATKSEGGGGGGGEQKGLLDWIMGGLVKQDQLRETDTVLQKVEEKNGGGGTSATRRKPPNSVSVPTTKKSNGGVFGGLFAKK